MSEATNYLENEVLDHFLGTAAYTAPTNVYVKLHTGAPGEDATGNAATETTRVEVTFGAASGGTATSNADVAWTNVSTSETYSHFSIWDASTAGNPLCYGAFAASYAVTAGDNFTIASGDLTVSLA